MSSHQRFNRHSLALRYGAVMIVSHGRFRSQKSESSDSDRMPSYGRHRSGHVGRFKGARGARAETSERTARVTDGVTCDNQTTRDSYTLSLIRWMDVRDPVDDGPGQSVEIG